MRKCVDGGRSFARRTFTTPKIRTFTTPKFGHLPPVHLPGGQLPPPIFFLFLAHFSWLFRLTLMEVIKDGKKEVLDEVTKEVVVMVVMKDVT